jgi:hypothetical protein
VGHSLCGPHGLTISALSSRNYCLKVLTRLCYSIGVSNLGILLAELCELGTCSLSNEIEVKFEKIKTKVFLEKFLIFLKLPVENGFKNLKK